MRDWPASPAPRFENAVFLDRDGTITVDTHYTHRLDDLTFLPGSLEALRRLARLPVHIIVVSNQAGIALGMFSEEQMATFNAALRDEVLRSGGRIDAFYYCPDKEPKDLQPGERPSPCAKPAPGLLLEAAADYRLLLGACYLIGDKLSDIAAGTAAGCHTILVETGKGGRGESELDATPDARAAGLLDAVALVAARLPAAPRLSAPLSVREPKRRPNP
jgi:D-glycero-D-manno-heptose 1,7-bisphosphate phosphatase